MNIESAKYLSRVVDYDKNTKENSMIEAVISGETMFVPLDPDNIHYAEILRQVEEGTLTIKDAE